MTILQQPDALSFSMNLKPFKINTAVDVAFALRQGGETLLTDSLSPDADDMVELSLRDVIHDRLSCAVPPDGNPYVQPAVAADFTAVFGSQSVSFRVIRGGVDGLSETVPNFVRANFLTWQPNVKPVTYSSPEFLSYYAVDSGCSLKVKAYFTDAQGNVTPGTEKTICSLTQGVVTTVSVQYAVIAGLYSNNLPAYYDVWVASGSTALTYIQRYYADALRSEEEQWFFFENSLGGIDTFRAFGAVNLDSRHTHNIAEIDDVSYEYRVDTERKWSVNTGHIDMRERRWLLDFFPSAGKYIYTDLAVRRIVLVDDSVAYRFSESPSSYAFTFRYADALPLLNLPRHELPVEMLDITVPDVGSFTLPPRLLEFTRQPLSEGVLFPVQSPYSEEWAVTSLGGIADYVRSLIHIPSPGLNRAELFQVLGGTPRAGERINPAFIDLSEFLTGSALGRYATLADLIRSVDGKLDTEFFASVFTVYDEDGNPIVPNTYEQAADNLQVMVGLWTEKYLSALGHNEEEGEGGGTGILDLQQLWEELGSSPWTDKVIHADHIPGLDASKIIRGVFNQERIPQLPISKITGLQDTLDGLQEALDGKLDTEFFSSVFTVYDEDGHAITPNTYEQVADNLRVLVGTWTNEYLSALGCNDEGGGTGILDKKELWEELGSSPWTDKVISDIHIPQLGIPKIEGLQNTLNTFALKARKIQTGNGLQGGGDLQADRTLSVKLRTVSSSTDNSGLKFTTDGSLYVYVVDSLTSTNQYRPLSAKQGKLLADRIAVLESLFEVDANGDVKTRDYTVNGVTKKRGLYSESFVSSLGANGDTSGGGTGVEMADVWRYLHGTSDDPNHVINAEHIPAMSTLSWSYGSVAGSSGSTYNGKAQKSFVIPKTLDHIADGTNRKLPVVAYTNKRFTLNGNDLVTASTIVADGGGIKTIKINGTPQTVSSNSVNLPAYPTLEGLMGSAKGSSTQPIYWDGDSWETCTSINADTLDSHDSSYFATADSLSGYLPLSAGENYPLTGYLYMGRARTTSDATYNDSEQRLYGRRGDNTLTAWFLRSRSRENKSTGVLSEYIYLGFIQSASVSYATVASGTQGYTTLSLGTSYVRASAANSMAGRIYLYAPQSDGATAVYQARITPAELTAHRTYTLPNITGTFIMDAGTQTLSGAKTFSSLLTANGGIVVPSNKSIKIGTIVLEDDNGLLKIWDGAGNAVKGIYATGTVSALGANISGGGGTGIEMPQVWEALAQAGNNEPINYTHIQSALTNNGYMHLFSKTNPTGANVVTDVSYNSGTGTLSVTRGNLAINALAPKDIPTTLATFYDGDNLIYTRAGGSNSVVDKPSGVDAFGVITMRTAAGYYGQILYGANGHIYYRSAATSSLGGTAWNTLLGTLNYKSYTYDKTQTYNKNMVLASSKDTNGQTASFRVLDAADIPSLPASKIGSGTLNAARLPDLSGTYLPLNGSSQMTGSLKTVRKNGMWIVGKTEAAIMYNGGTPLADASTSEWLFNMVSSSGNTIGFGGLKDTIGFYGWLSDRTANGTDWSTSFNTGSGVLTISSLGSGSNLVLSKSSTTSEDYPAQITFNPIDSTTGYQTGVAQCYIRAYNDHSSPSGTTATNGANMVIRSGGNIFIGGGEAAQNHYNAIKEAATNLTKEYTFITSDNNIYLQSFTSTDGIANRKGLVVTQGGNLIPCLVDEYNDSATNSIGSSTYPFYALYASNSVKIGNCTISWDSTNNLLKFSTGIYSEGTVSALGANNNSSGGGGADIADVWDALARPDLSKLIDSSHINITTSGYGNAVTGITSSGTSITLNKGTSFLPLTGNTSSTPISNDVYFANNKSLVWKVASGSVTYDVLKVNAANQLELGLGTSTAGKSTYIDGHNIYLRYGSSQTLGLTLSSSGAVTIKNNLTVDGTSTLTGAVTANHTIYIWFKNGNGTLGGLGTASSAVDSGLGRLSANGSNVYKLWDSGNDGSGSGLDADLLDGNHGHWYMKRGAGYSAGNSGTKWYKVATTELVSTTNTTQDIDATFVVSSHYDRTSAGILHLQYRKDSGATVGSSANTWLRWVSRKNSLVLENFALGHKFFTRTNSSGATEYVSEVNLYVKLVGTWQSVRVTLLDEGAWYGKTNNMTLLTATNDANSVTDIPADEKHTLIDGVYHPCYSTDVSYASNAGMLNGVEASGYVTITGAQKITGVKTFDVNTLIVNGGEVESDVNKSTIRISTMGNNSYKNATGTAAYAQNSGIRNCIRFDWYDTAWAIGNVRGGGKDSQGFAIGYMNSGKDGVLHRFLIQPNGDILTNASITAGSEITASSDERLKTINGDTILTIKDIADAPAIKFLWNDKRDEKVHIGSIAQYWENALPEAVSYDGNGIMSLNYGALALVSAITIARDLMRYEDRLTKLEKKNKRLERRISELERRIA